jgi:peptidoglycan/xylan/chitin deacetylase (PgdA/CDA1 family)
MKQGLLQMMSVTGMFDLFRLLNRNRALILTYHRFSANGYGEHTSAAAFNEQLAYLKAHYQVVPLSRIVERLSVNGSLPPGMAAITIDDGYSDSYEIAYPLLKRYGVPATIFLVTDFVERYVWMWTDKIRYITAQACPQGLAITIDGEPLRFELDDHGSRVAASERINAALKRLSEEMKEETIKELASLLDVIIPATPPDDFSAVSWEEVHEMARIGIEFGSHTLTHPILTNVGDEQLRQELTESRTHIEAVLRRRVDQFCYPNGNYNERVAREVARAGYGSAVTTVSGLVEAGDEPFTLRRIHTEFDLPHFLQSTSGFEQLKVRLRSSGWVPGNSRRGTETHRRELEVPSQLEHG